MKRIGKNILQSLLFIPFVLILFNSSIKGLEETNNGSWRFPILDGIKDTIVEDTTKLPFPFKDNNDPYAKQNENSPLYLKNPSNVQTEIEYDPISGEYTIRQKVGDIEVRPSNTMSSNEFNSFTRSNSISDYWVEQRKMNSKNSSANESFLEKYLNPKLNVNIKGFDKVFGSNVIDIKPQGSAELIFGVNISKIENPTLPIDLQRSTTFDFDMKIQMGVTGKIGEKMKVGINYNTEAQFDFENQTTISYTGDEDEIIQSIEAGNVSLPLTGTLITGSQSLFGLKTALQFGKLKVTSIFSQQKSESSVIEVEGGAQTSDYQFKVDEYESNKHFFLAQYFKDTYDRALQSMPIINSGINITRIEVWVTNKKEKFENSRNILGLMDLAEDDKNIYAKPLISQTGTGLYPYNDINNLYSLMSGIADVRDINRISSAMPAELRPIIDYAKIENARMLTPNEYTLNSKLGYISLNSSLNDDEVLAVAYEYTIGGETRTVGEFSNSGIKPPSTLFLKLIKGPALQPGIPTWNLMMKNVYFIGSYQINSDDFELNILYNDDKTGTTVNYINAGNITGIPLLKVMGLDQLNTQLDPQPDGYFDFIDKLTINAANGRIYFPVREPFGKHLRAKINDETVADKYVFEELYDSTQSKARQLAEKNKFILKGSYKSAGGSEISLNAFNIPEGSVKASANGKELNEGTDYIVDYNLGKVSILNQGLLESGTPIRISLENNSMFNINRKTLLGTHLDYIISDKFALGGTILHLSEKPLTNKVNIGSEPISNTIWGLDGSYSTDVPLLTRIIDALPFLETKEMSTIEVNGEFAHLIPGHSKSIGKDGNAYIDDFEGTKTSIDLKAQYTWVIASTPKGQPMLFPEGDLMDRTNGFNRAKLAWYNVNTDLLRPTSATPGNITADDQSNHYVREVYEKELFPYKESLTGFPTILNITNLAYYPKEKGPYNYDVGGASGISSGIDIDGNLKDPETRWGGIMREIQTNDFEASNIEFIEFWVMDPFIYKPNDPGGDLYFNLGYISEDILKDGRKSFENGLPTSTNTSLVDTTVWGRVPLQQSLVNAFDNDPNARKYQDVGLDGLSNEDERSYFVDYLDSILGTYGAGSNAYINAEKDPSSDDYRFFRGHQYDVDNASILDRYKAYNGLEGNSPTASQSPEPYATSATLLPDIEDINHDNTLNEEETYFQYKVSLKPNDMVVGQNYITDKIQSEVKLKNENVETVTWYQFKIPIKKPENQIGPISDFRSIRFIRMFMHDFQDTMIMRFARLDLVRSEWRNYEGSIPEGAESIGIPQSEDNEGFDISVVSIEENGKRTPINYVLPPGITRIVDPTNPYLRQLNEQSIAYKITNLNDGDARAAYKNLDIDIRQYNKLQMEVHAEASNETEILNDNDLAAFLRLGSDYRENYYEVEIPLTLTPYRSDYDNESDADRRLVWPEENRFDFELQQLQLVKQHRNNKMNEFGSTVQYSTAYVEYVGNMKITIVGNPNLSNLKTVMLGVRNPSRENNTRPDDGLSKSGIVWFNELRLTDFRENGGWAANTSVSTKLADLGSITVAGNTSTHGFGSIEKKVNERQKEDIFQYDISSNLELGKFFPQKNRVRIPLYFGYSENTKTPEYNPLDPDILLKTTLSDPELPKADKAELQKIVLDYTQRKSFNINNLKIEGDPLKLEGKKKRFYHISNFSMSFAYSELFARNIKTEHNIQRNYAGSFAYVFNNRPKSFEPFNKVKFLQKKAFLIIKDMNLYLAPTMVSFRSDMNRQYQQMKIRDISQEKTIIEPTFKKDFIWNRVYDVKYSITKGLKFEYSANNKARIDEAFGIMDRNDPEYMHKRDTIWENILGFGRNVKYNHSINATYAIPINKLPLFRWTSATAMYRSTYEWGAAPISADTSINLGNTIANSNTIQLNGTLNFSRLYDKVPFLKSINNKMKSGGKSTKKFRDVKFSKEKVNLKKDIPKSITHNLLTEDVQIKVKDDQGNEVKGELIVVNQNKVKFKADGDYKNTNVEVSGKKEIKDNIFRKIGEGTVYAMIGLKNVSISYSETSGTILPGYKPTTKYIGLSDQNGVYAPGFPFILGIQNDSLPRYASDNNWLSQDSLQTLPYVMNFTNNLNVKATVEPLKGLKIDLTTSRRTAKNRNEYWTPDENGIFNPHNQMFTGNFSMSYMMIQTSFWKFGDNYSSKAYENFKENRIVIANRLALSRSSAMLPSSPVYDRNQPNLDPITGEIINNDFPNGYGPESQEVMIPAFLAAYSDGSAENVTLSPFPKIPIPNWRITYDGLSEIDILKRFIKNINLNQSYSSSYNVGSYNTNPNYDWAGIGADGLSWARHDINDMFIPEQEINSVSLIEEFKPLISADITWINNFNSKIELNRSRSITLGFSNNQVIDLSDKEIIIGLGYRFDKLPIIIKTGKGNQQKFQSDLNLRSDLSIRDMLTIIRKIDEQVDQITAGQKAVSIKFSADYALNERFNLKLFYDHAISSPKISTSFRTSNIKFGISVRFTLIP